LLAELPAVALKVVVGEPAGTVIVDAGTGSKLLLLASEIVVPPAGAAWLRVTVQVVWTPLAKLEGLHAKDESMPAAVRLIVAVRETPFSVEVSVAV